MEGGEGEWEGEVVRRFERSGENILGRGKVDRCQITLRNVRAYHVKLLNVYIL